MKSIYPDCTICGNSEDSLCVSCTRRYYNAQLQKVAAAEAERDRYRKAIEEALDKAQAWCDFWETDRTCWKGRDFNVVQIRDILAEALKEEPRAQEPMAREDDDT